MLFGVYIGSDCGVGLCWVNFFVLKKCVLLCDCNLNVLVFKVND